MMPGKQQDPQEMVRYFSDFLIEINCIIDKIKMHTYEMVDICLPTPTLLTVYQSMASIVAQTNKTYDNLKRIESVMSGLVKAKRIQSCPTTPAHKYRSKSAENNIFFYPKQNTKRSPHANLTHLPQELDSLTIKKSHFDNKDCASKNGKTNAQAVQETQQEEEDDKTVKMEPERIVQEKTGYAEPLKDWKQLIAQRINALITSNRTGMSRIMDKNMECLRLVRSVRKDIQLR